MGCWFDVVVKEFLCCWQAQSRLACPAGTATADDNVQPPVTAVYVCLLDCALPRTAVMGRFWVILVFSIIYFVVGGTLCIERSS
jgi:hypothetical protein